MACFGQWNTSKSTEPHSVLFCVLLTLCRDNQQCGKKRPAVAAGIPKGRRVQQSRSHPWVHMKHRRELALGGWKWLDFFSMPQDSLACLSHAWCIFKLLHLREGCGLLVGIYKLEVLFLAALRLLLKICGHCFSTVENADTMHPPLISGTQPRSPGCGTSQIIQSPVSLQGTGGVVLITPWSLDTIRTSFRCSRSKPKEGTPLCPIENLITLKRRCILSISWTILQSAALRQLAKVWAVGLLLMVINQPIDGKHSNCFQSTVSHLEKDNLLHYDRILVIGSHVSAWSLVQFRVKVKLGPELGPSFCGDG